MEWINVKDKLPENEELVDVWISSSEQRGTDLRYRNGNFEYFILDYDGDYSHSEIADGVTYWMPSPNPPK